MKYINKHEIRVWAIRGSGQHAIINWIASLFEQPVVFCNNCRPTVTPYFKSTNVRGKELRQLYYPNRNIARDNRYKELIKLKKQCLIYNHENRDFKKWGWHAGEDQIGKSKFQYDVLVMRSFRNLLASWLRNPPKKLVKFEKQIIPLYKLYINEFLNFTNHLEFQTVTIWFDTWVKNEQYRKQKASIFGRENEDWTLRFMGNFCGRGSHFDNFHENYNKAHKMKVNERYKQMQEHPKYIELMEKYTQLDKDSNYIHERAELL